MIHRFANLPVRTPDELHWGLGWIGSRAEARILIQASFPPVAYLPGDPALWDATYARLKAWPGQSTA